MREWCGFLEIAACGAHELALTQTPAESSAGTGGGKTPGVRHVDPGDCVALPRHSTISASRCNFRVFLRGALLPRVNIKSMLWDELG